MKTEVEACWGGYLLYVDVDSANIELNLNKRELERLFIQIARELGYSIEGEYNGDD